LVFFAFVSTGLVAEAAFGLLVNFNFVLGVLTGCQRC
jgi:hypothetical protein